MERYIEQLLADIIYATENVSFPFVEKDLNLHDWLSDEEENRIAPVRDLEVWTGIYKEMLPPAEKLNDQQTHLLLEALKKMLDAYNCSFVLQTQVPEDVQYESMRCNFNQQVRVKRWHMGFFELCRPGTEHRKCVLGEYCQCEFYTEFFSNFSDEELSAEEERERSLEIEIKHLKRKYGDEWMKYYPYHLDANYDDEKGNPYNYGFDPDGDGENDDDNWWR